MRNVVVVTYDSLRADHCGHLGYDRDTTPKLDAMAAEGVTYENAIAPASRTNPSMAGIFTGKPMVVRDRVANPKNAREHIRAHEPIAERLSRRGYETGAFCPNAYASRYYGFDRGFDRYEDFMFDSDVYQSLFEGALSDSAAYTMVRNARNFVRREEAFRTWDSYVDDIEEWAHERTEPFFLWTFSLDTHFPYLTPRSHRQWGSLIDNYYYNWRCNRLINDLEIDLSAREKQKIIDIYDDSIRFGDALLGELQERLAAYDPVYVVFGDHGEAFDERGLYGHFYPALYEEHVHVPLVVSGVDDTDRIEAPATLLDLPEMLVRLADSNRFEGDRWGHDWVFATDDDGRFDRDLTTVRTRDWKYLRTVENGDTRDELFDLRSDPAEADDRVGTDHPIEGALRELVDGWCAHENELLAIREAVETTLGDRTEPEPVPNPN